MHACAACLETWPVPALLFADCMTSADYFTPRASSPPPGNGEKHCYLCVNYTQKN